MMSDIKRICEQPTDEDRSWFPALPASAIGARSKGCLGELPGRELHRAVPIAK